MGTRSGSNVYPQSVFCGFLQLKVYVYCMTMFVMVEVELIRLVLDIQMRPFLVGNDQEMAQSEKNTTPKTEKEKTKLTPRYSYKENIS